MSCNICCDLYNRSTKSIVICRFDDCKYEACKECVRTYLINTTAEPHCMKCRKKWDLEYLKSNLNASFMHTDYREHRKNILLDSAISKMSEHYPNAIIYNNQKKAEKEIRKKMKQIDELQNQISGVYREISAIRNDPALKLKDGVEERRKFVMPCQSEGCRGMLSTAYKCDLCEKYTCSKCFISITGNKDEHVCVQADIDTAEELKRNTKPCPQCGTRISKIDGCDQMWCVECKTAFSWNRGTVETGNIHNPHFFQWMRTNGGQIGDGGGGCNRNNHREGFNRIIDNINTLSRMDAVFNNFVYNINQYGEKTLNAIEVQLYNDLNSKEEFKFYTSRTLTADEYFHNYYRFLNHLENVDLRNIQRSIEDRDGDNMLFYKYILNECEKEELGDFLIRRDISNVKDSSLRDILDAFVIAGRQIIEECGKELSTVFQPIFKEDLRFVWSHLSSEPNFMNYRSIQSNTSKNIIQLPKTKYSLFIPATTEFYNKYFDDINIIEAKFVSILEKYYKIIDNYTNYTNYELLRYLILHNLRRNLTVWNHSRGDEEILRFDSKSAIVSKMKEFSSKIEKKCDLSDQDEAENSWV